MPDDTPNPSARRPRQPRRSRGDAKRETREALIAAGIAAFAEEGLDAPSLDSICARAGYTRGAFYVHFTDRDDFLVAAMAHLFEAFLDLIIATGDAALDLQKTIDTFVGAVENGTFPVAGGLHFHQFLGACTRNPRIRAPFVTVLDQATARVAVAVEEGQGAGTVRKDVNPHLIATILVGLAMGAHAAIEVGYAFHIGPVAADLSRMIRPPA
jgi:AcrR family transcriptional regulator